MTALSVLLAEPAIQVVLVQLIQRDPVAVEPVQELESVNYAGGIKAGLELVGQEPGPAPPSRAADG
jgi:hypothetical protein